MNQSLALGLSIIIILPYLHSSSDMLQTWLRSACSSPITTPTTWPSTRRTRSPSSAQLREDPHQPCVSWRTDSGWPTDPEVRSIRKTRRPWCTGCHVLSAVRQDGTGVNCWTTTTRLDTRRTSPFWSTVSPPFLDLWFCAAIVRNV